MGFCLSCCRRKPAKDSERRPLLRSVSTDIRPARTPLEHAADILAALHAGKLPSQDQLSGALRWVLASDILRVEKRAGGNALSAEGDQVVEDVKEVVTVLLQLGLEKNDDNLIQNMIYTSRQLRSVPLQVKDPLDIKINQEPTGGVAAAALAIPTEAEIASDTAALITAMQTLASLVLTSSAFRLILSDVLSTAREIITNSVQRVRETAELVENVATMVEETVRPGEQNVKPSDRPSTAKKVRIESEDCAEEEVPDHEPKDFKEVILERIENIIRQAQASPSYNSAFRTIIFLIRKYATRLQIASTSLAQAAASATENPIEVSAPIIAPDPQFSRILGDMKALLERFAGGRSLDPLLNILSKTVTDIVSTSASTSGGKHSQASTTSDYFNRIGVWLDTALTDAQFAGSRAGRLSSSKLYDEGKSFLTQNEEVRSDVQELIQELQNFTEAIANDRITSRFVSALTSLQSSTHSFLYASARQSLKAAQHWRLTALRLTIGWLLPRFLSAIKTVPMPRVEYLQKDWKGGQLAVALDSLLLSAAEALVPDVLTVQEWGEVRLEMDSELGATGIENVNSQVLAVQQDLNRAHENGQPAESILPAFFSTGGSRSAFVAGSSGLATDSNRNIKQAKLSTSSRIHIHVEGLRVEAHDLGYYVRYDLNSWLSYEDEGLMSIDIGKQRRRGEGLGMDIELEVDTDSTCSSEDIETKLFRVSSVHTTLPGLALRIAQSKHWILNSVLLAPFAGPVGRVVGTRIFSAQVKSVLEKGEEFMRSVKRNVDEKATQRSGNKELLREGENDVDDIRIWDWWEAILENFGGGEDVDSEDDDDGQDFYTESHTNATFGGIMHETYIQPEPVPFNGRDDEEFEQPPLQETTIAVGLGAQILPGKAEPLLARESPSEIAKNVGSEVQEAVDDAVKAGEEAHERTKRLVGEGISRAAEARREIEGAEVRMKKREGLENRKSGWRSRAFDL